MPVSIGHPHLAHSSEPACPSCLTFRSLDNHIVSETSSVSSLANSCCRMFASVEDPLLHVVILPCQKQAYAAMNLNTTKFQLAADAAAGTVFERGLRLFGSLGTMPVCWMRSSTLPPRKDNGASHPVSPFQGIYSHATDQRRDYPPIAR
jgi:hypothetical protein